jgi:uncharacterized membrane protein
MKETKPVQVMMTAAIASVIAVSLAEASVFAQQKQPTQTKQEQQATEHCYGIAKKGMNDCKSGLLGCQGQAKIDRDPQAFIVLPAGTCKKIAGGNLSPT